MANAKRPNCCPMMAEAVKQGKVRGTRVVRKSMRFPDDEQRVWKRRFNVVDSNGTVILKHCGTCPFCGEEFNQIAGFVN